MLDVFGTCAIINTLKQKERKMFEVVKMEAAETGTDYYIKNVETGEVRVLRDCICYDEEVFDISDFEECETV